MKRNTLLGALGIGAVAGLAGLVNGCGTQRLYSNAPEPIANSNDNVSVEQDSRCNDLVALFDNVKTGATITVNADSLYNRETEEADPLLIPFTTGSSLGTEPTLEVRKEADDNGGTSFPFDASYAGVVECGNEDFHLLKIADNENNRFLDGSTYTINARAVDRFGHSGNYSVRVSYEGGLSNSDLTDIVDDIVEQLPPRPQDSERVNALVDYACDLPRSQTGDIKFYAVGEEQDGMSSFVELGENSVTNPDGKFIHHNLSGFNNLGGKYIVAVAGEYDNTFQVERMASAQIGSSYNPESCPHIDILNLDYANDFAPKKLRHGQVFSVSVYPTASSDMNSPYFEWDANDSAHSEVARSKRIVRPLTYSFSFGDVEARE